MSAESGDAPGDAPARPARIEIGGIARAHGIRGEVVIVTHDPDSDTLAELAQLYLDGAPRRVLAARPTHRGWLVQLEGVDTRTAAEGLRGRPVEVDREALALDEGDVLLADLVGCAVRLPDGTPWGVVAAIDSVPGGLQDRLVIHDGALERMLPLVDALVPAIDVDARVITVDPPAGLPAWPIDPRAARGAGVGADPAGDPAGDPANDPANDPAPGDEPTP